MSQTVGPLRSSPSPRTARPRRAAPAAGPHQRAPEVASSMRLHSAQVEIGVLRCEYLLRIIYMDSVEGLALAPL